MDKPLAERAFVGTCEWDTGSVRYTGAELDTLGFDANQIARVERLGVGQSARFYAPFNGWVSCHREG